MILDTLDEADRYDQVHPLFARAFAFLRELRVGELRVGELAVGRFEIDGDTLYAMVADGEGRERAAADLEAHRRFIDIQLVLEGVEEMGWRPLARCSEEKTAYDAESDIVFFGEDPDVWLTVHPGCFAIFFPEDAHAPMVGAGRLHKVVVKVAVD
jgi:YhcH/YjgK/YiaL family protein